MHARRHLDFFLFFQMILFAQLVFRNTFDFLFFHSSHPPMYMSLYCMISVLAFALFSFFLFQMHFIPVSEREKRGGSGNRKKKTSFVMSSFVEYLSLVVGDVVFFLSLSPSLFLCRFNE